MANLQQKEVSALVLRDLEMLDKQKLETENKT